MALDKTGLISNLVTLFTTCESSEKDKTYFATQLANYIDTYVKSGTVIVTTSTPGAQAGGSTLAGTGTGTVT